MPKKNHNQLRSRTTRSSKPRLLTDPTSSTQLLTTQLQSLGLYAAHTIGDGNCLFRALSDQVHGSPEKHRQVRKQICDWIEQHKERYEGFVEDDDYLVDDLRTKKGSRDKGKGLEAHLRCMRENATYGGHMELSAFAHLTKRNIKVIQPGLVYVIEWHAGESSQTSTNPTPPSSSPKSSQDHPEPRRSKRTQRTSVSSSSSPKQSSSTSNQDENKQIVKIGTGKHGYYVYEEVSDSDDDNNLEDSPKQDLDGEEGGSEKEGGGETVYVAYHDWEHFSSIRNLRGPHAGLPHVRETPAQSVLAQRELEKEALKEREREKKRKDKEREREIKKTNVTKVKLKLSSPSGSAASSTPQPMAISTSLSSLSSCSSLTSIGSTTASTITAITADPTLIPLPNSRSVSPFPPIPTSDTAQSHVNPDTQTDSASMSTSTLASTLATPLPPISIPTISSPIPATPTSPTSTPVSSISTIHSSHPHAHSHLHQHLHQHQHRSPKRTFDESSASGEDGDGGSGGSTGGSGCSGREKRSRVGSVVGGRSRLGAGSGGGDADVDTMDVDRDTPGLSAPGSSSSSSSSATSPDSSSDLTSPSPPPQQILVEPERVSSPPHSHAKLPKSKKGMKFSYGSKPLTRRQRKALGLPKARPSPSNLPTTTTSGGAGKIIIPGGKWRGRQTQTDSTAVSVVEGGDGGDEEWRRNGTGRVDVRGFRELKI